MANPPSPTPPPPQKAFIIIVGHDITTTPTVPPGLQPLSLPLQATTKRDGPERTKNNIVGVGVFVVECKLDFIFRHFENIILSNVVVVVLSLDTLKKNYKKKFISELGGG